MLLLAMLSAVLAGPIYVVEGPDGSITFTDTPAAKTDFRVFMDGKVLPPMSKVNLSTFPSLDSYDAQILAASQRHGVPAALIKAVCLVESGMKAAAVSKAGAQGLMQLMPGTASDLAVTDPFDAGQSIDGGTRYLAQQRRAFNSDRLALAAYNAGPQNVKKYGGVPPFDETQRYVDKVMALYDHFRYQRPIPTSAGEP